MACGGQNGRSTKPIFEPLRKLKVVCVGAGASGLLLTYKIQRHFSDFDLQVFEKNADVGGTWFENRYPGHVFPSPQSMLKFWNLANYGNLMNHANAFFQTDWSASYATAKEIYQYFKDFSTRYGLDRFIKVNNKVIAATWDKNIAEWHVKAENTITKEITETSCHILVNAGGILNAWQWPAVPGLKDYKGQLVHSAAWGEDVDIKGKVVGLIGNGSSGIQILPSIKNDVKHLVTFIREATWISPPFGQGYEEYTDEDRDRFARDPEYHLQTRREIEKGISGVFAQFYAGSEAQAKSRQYMQALMEARLANKDLEKLLIPSWSVGCRRLTPGVDYLESLTAPNVTTVFGNITHCTEAGVVCETGDEYPVDVLICATGFDTSYRPRFPLLGTTKTPLSDEWKEEPAGYMGLAVNNYPNYFMTLGPNSPIGNGPLLICVEAEVDYMIKFMSKFQKENIRSFDVKAEAVADFNEWKDGFMSNMVWTEECRSWYKAGSISGKVVALWPGSSLHFLETLESPRWEDWNFSYMPNRNRFEYLGNGHSSAEARPGGDPSYYIRNKDDSPIDVCLNSKKAGGNELKTGLETGARDKT